MISAITKESKRRKRLVHFRNKLHIRLICTYSVPQQRYMMQQELFTLNLEPFERNAVSVFPLGGFINFRGRVDVCFVPFPTWTPSNSASGSIQPSLRGNVESTNLPSTSLRPHMCLSLASLNASNNLWTELDQSINCIRWRHA